MGPVFQYVMETRFDVPGGTCVLDWTPEALWALELPREWEHAPPSLERGLEARAPDEDDRAPPHVREAIRRIQAHVGGRVPSYEDLPVDLEAFRPFTRQVLEAVRRIPAGEVRTYAEVARAVGRPRAARAVARAVAANPLPLVIPCHRVVASSGGLGGFSAPGGVATKRWLLGLEGMVVPAAGDSG